MTITKTQLAEVKKNGNKLVKSVVSVILDQEKDYQENFMKEVVTHGCVSGIVGNLIYYHDTAAFYKKHKTEINALLKESLSESGYKSPAELFGDKWDDEDPLAQDDQNQNLLAWFAFEETTRNVMNELGMDD